MFERSSKWKKRKLIFSGVNRYKNVKINISTLISSVLSSVSTRKSLVSLTLMNKINKNVFKLLRDCVSSKPQRDLYEVTPSTKTRKTIGNFKVQISEVLKLTETVKNDGKNVRYEKNEIRRNECFEKNVIYARHVIRKSKIENSSRLESSSRRFVSNRYRLSSRSCQSFVIGFVFVFGYVSSRLCISYVLLASRSCRSFVIGFVYVSSRLCRSVVSMNMLASLKNEEKSTKQEQKGQEETLQFSNHKSCLHLCTISVCILVLIVLFISVYNSSTLYHIKLTEVLTVCVICVICIVCALLTNSIHINVLSMLLSYIVPDVSVAKVSSCLIILSIKISNICPLSTSFSIGPSCLIFTKLESNLWLDIQILPEKGPKEIIKYCLIIKGKKNSKNLICVFIYRRLFLNNQNLIKKEYVSMKYYDIDQSKDRDTLSGRKTLTAGIIKRKLLLRSGDIESNPGPEVLTLTTQNCRGLKNKEKVKQLLCRLNNSAGTQIIALQETHLESAYIKYSWHGNVALTPSCGAKGGIITLVSGNVNILEQFDIENDAQILLAEMLDNRDTTSLIIVNLHSPCAHDQTKIEFFEKIKEHINDLTRIHDNCEIIMLGDFNTTFWSSERINTKRTKCEETVAENITEMFNEFNLKDCWSKFDSSMTWRHGEKMSRLDRILWSESLELKHNNTSTDWSLTSSDHSAVVVKLTSQKQMNKRTMITRIDTTFMSNIKLRTIFLREIDERMNQLKETNLDPHGKLEFLKMSIRSVAIDIASNHRKDKEKEFKEIESGLKFWQSTFENSTHPKFNDIARQNLDILIARRNTYLNERGKYLSERSKSKWYQEGERSTKYFLNLNKAKNNKNEMVELLIDGNLTSDQNQINDYVERFYTQLYEKGDAHETNSTDLDLFLGNLDRVPDEMVKLIESNLSTEEIYETLKDCDDSAPGPDGIPYSLIKLTWNYFGKTLIESWNYAEKIGKLAPSHDMSYLRLLPKEGKDTRLLKNWRPITLSNCDFKLITKTLSWRLAKAVDSVISPNQTAYMRDRQISDNLNIMLYTIEQSKEKEGMIVSLDAEKAFDSIEHWYIKEVLKKIGLNCFLGTFNLLYKSQLVEIILNGSNAGNYRIKNGVKQGDALSCILFILGVEPLLRKINEDSLIENLRINDIAMPRAIAYADDICCLIKPKASSLQRIFDNYDELTKLSGLRLNADKTELIAVGGPDSYNVTYDNKDVRIDKSSQIKINGLMLSFDTEQARNDNVSKMYDAVKKQLFSWSKRSLSILGKIQIFKTFGLSQILYTLAVLQLTKKEERSLTNLIYKYIWTKNLDGNKAPDRLKRQILLNKIKELGFGMINYVEVVEGIRIRNLIRLLNSDRGTLSDIIKSSVTSSLINLKNIYPIRDTIDGAIKQFRLKWLDCISQNQYNTNPSILRLVGREYIGNLVKTNFRKQKIVRELRNESLSQVAIVNVNHPIFRKLIPSVASLLINLQNKELLHSDISIIKWDEYPHKGKTLIWPKISSKVIRESNRKANTQSPKLIENPILEQTEHLGRIIASLTNSKLKSILLRCLHGDVYSKDRMLRFGMTTDNLCPRCAEVETIKHMLFECQYVRTIWQRISKLTGIKPNSMNEVLGYNLDHDKITITIHAEVLRRLLAIDRPDYDPNLLIRSAIKNLYILERGVTKFQISKYLEFFDKNIANNGHLN